MSHYVPLAAFLVLFFESENRLILESHKSSVEQLGNWVRLSEGLGKGHFSDTFAPDFDDIKDKKKKYERDLLANTYHCHYNEWHILHAEVTLLETIHNVDGKRMGVHILYIIR